MAEYSSEIMDDLTIVTAASSNHFHCLTNLLYSICYFEPNIRVIIHDLGFKIAETQQLKDNGYDVHQFRFESYPAYFNIAVDCGQYAWKPVIVANTLEKAAGMILWLDAGNLITTPLDKIRNLLTREGIYSPASSGTILQWTHPKTLEYLNAIPNLLAKRNRDAAIIGFNPKLPGIKHLTERWKQCALDVDCIAPAGSNRFNHRQDQSVLSILMYQLQQAYGYTFVDTRLGISTHNDQLSFDEVYAKLKASKLKPKETSR
jgi:hypothetical protein